jgi:hypothetical protein
MQIINLLPKEKNENDYGLDCITALHIILLEIIIFFLIYLVFSVNFWYEDYRLENLQESKLALGSSLEEASKFRIGQAENQKQLEKLLEKEIDTKRRNLAYLSTLEKINSTSNVKFSKYLYTLSKHSFDGIWVKYFKIFDSGNKVIIAGQTTDPQHVAKYVGDMINESKFHAKELNVFKVFQDPKSPNLLNFIIDTDGDFSESVYEQAFN